MLKRNYGSMLGRLLPIFSHVLIEFIQGHSKVDIGQPSELYIGSLFFRENALARQIKTSLNFFKFVF